MEEDRQLLRFKQKKSHEALKILCFQKICWYLFIPYKPLKKHNHHRWLCFFHVLKQVCIYTIRVMRPTSGLVGLVQQKHPGGIFLQTVSPKVRAARDEDGEEPRHTTATGAKR